MALMPPRQLWLGLTLLALVACAPPRVTGVPHRFESLAPIAARVDPHLWTLTERWATGGTAGDAPVGDVLRRVLVDDPRAPLCLTYAASRLDVATVVSPRWDRPDAYVARYELTVRVESPATGGREAWLQGIGESRSLASPARAANNAITQAVRELSGRLARRWDARAARDTGL
jgi:hypothetical protein